MPINRIILFVFLLVFIVLPFGGRTLDLYIDWLWFNELSQQQVFLTIFSSKLAVGLGAGLLTFFLIYLNLRIALRYKASGLPPQFINMTGIPNLENIIPRVGAIGTVLALFVALSYGMWAASQWQHVLLFFNETSFNHADPLFGRDFSFYTFRLPLFLDIQNWLFTTIGLSATILVPVYFLRGGVSVNPRGLYVDRPPKVHISILVGVLFLLKAWDYFLQRFQLLLEQRGVIFGASYADIHATLPALETLTVAAVVAGLLIIGISFRRGWKAPLTAAAVVVIGHFVGLSVLPDLLHKFKVVPNEIAAESTYIRHNIAATRYAYGLNTIDVKEFPAEENLTPDAIHRNSLTIKNIRLWDHRPLLTTYRQLQQIRTYYDFVDVDNDRYTIDGEYRQIMLSPRELSYDSIPGLSWINEHFTYTHGYGVALGPVNRISKEGLPEFFIKDIPPISTTPSLKVTRPEIYFSEKANDYVFVKTTAKEFDYPSGDQNVYTEYKGTGGIPAGSLLNKLVFAARFGTMKILLSNDITAESRIMINRTILPRVAKIAPYLRFDQDPYMVITKDGRLVWIIDGYTVTDMIPYSQPIRRMGNYIRNSVKVVVDAYNGTTDFYINDDTDPLVRAYAAIFPTLYKPLAKMPADIRAHLRYPQDLFTIQARMFETYHMTDPQIFYNKEDLWATPRRNVGGGETEMEPYYTIMKLPGEEKDGKEEFLLTLPFTPAKRDNMAALMAARSDVPNYGKIVVYIMPKQKLVFGPRQIEARIDQDAEISQQLTLWSQRGSQVIRGSLLAIPVEGSLLYVEPLYLAAEAGSLPELRRVVVSYANKVVMEETLEKALESVFGNGVERKAVSLQEVPTPSAAAPSVASLKELARLAQEYYNKATKAQQQGDWGRYGEALKQLESVIKQMNSRK